MLSESVRTSELLVAAEAFERVGGLGNVQSGVAFAVVLSIEEKQEKEER